MPIGAIPPNKLNAHLGPVPSVRIFLFTLKPLAINRSTSWQGFHSPIAHPYVNNQFAGELFLLCKINSRRSNNSRIHQLINLQTQENINL